MNKNDIDKLNYLTINKIPFLTIINFDKTICHIITEFDDNIKFSMDNKTSNNHNISLQKFPIDFISYKKKFDKLIDYIKDGNTYLLNLTSKTKIIPNASLLEIYKNSNAKFKLYFKDEFVCFSPERFIKIENSKIQTYPMKGTIDANIDYAYEKIINNKKEMAEHTMVVDLLRNDLSIVSNKVRVEEFRYADIIKAGEKELIQISSKITGEINPIYKDKIGTILDNLLPAGSITGTPKKETVRIIKEIEEYEREFFTGIFGYFDGETFDSAVMIRFIQKENDEYFYKSGGGITLDSDERQEYKEMIDKVYIP